MISIYVPFCQGKMASEELLASHRTYLAVSAVCRYGPLKQGQPLYKGQQSVYLTVIPIFCVLQRVQSLFGIETPLSTLMIKPVQRITKYPLLFKVSHMTLT